MPPSCSDAIELVRAANRHVDAPRRFAGGPGILPRLVQPRAVESFSFPLPVHSFVILHTKKQGVGGKEYERDHSTARGWSAHG
jgi:hypothetical protein